MKTLEDEAFDELARRQGAWGGGFPAKRQAAMDKINSDFDEEYKKMHEDRIKYGTSWEQDGRRIDPMSVYKEPVIEREALKLAFEALEHISKFGCNHVRGVCTCEYREAADAIKAALAQPAQPPQNYVWRVSNKVAAFYFWSEDAARKAANTTGSTWMNVTPVSLVDVAQPAQAPVATVTSESGNPNVTMSWWHEPALPVGTKLYTAPPQREWVGLTDADIEDCVEMSIQKTCRAIEAKLKEKNS